MGKKSDGFFNHRLNGRISTLHPFGKSIVIRAIFVTVVPKQITNQLIRKTEETDVALVTLGIGKNKLLNENTPLRIGIQRLAGRLGLADLQHNVLVMLGQVDPDAAVKPDQIRLVLVIDGKTPPLYHLFEICDKNIQGLIRTVPINLYV